jgi:hypothetical protein
MPILMILARWKYVAIIGATVGFCYWLHSLDLERVELKNRAAISKAITSANNAAVESCQEAQVTTQRISYEYQKDVAALRGKLDAAKQLRPNSCIEVYTALTASRRNAAALAAKSPREDAGTFRGVTREALLDFTEEPDVEKVRLIKCQAYAGELQSQILASQKTQGASQ